MPIWVNGKHNYKLIFLLLKILVYNFLCSFWMSLFREDASNFMHPFPDILGSLHFNILHPAQLTSRYEECSWITLSELEFLEGSGVSRTIWQLLSAHKAPRVYIKTMRRRTKSFSAALEYYINPVEDGAEGASKRQRGSLFLLLRKG